MNGGEVENATPLREKINRSISYLRKAATENYIHPERWHSLLWVSSCTHYIVTRARAAVATTTRNIGFTQVSVSHEESAADETDLIRGSDTTVLTYLPPILRRLCNQ